MCGWELTIARSLFRDIKVLLIQLPHSVHVLGQKKWLLQGFNYVSRVTSLELLNRGVPRDSSPVHLKTRRPGAVLNAYLGQILLFSAVHRSGPLVLRVFGLFCCLVPF